MASSLIKPEAAGTDEALAAGIERAARGSGQPLAEFVAEKHPLKIVRQLEAVGRGGNARLHGLDQIGSHNNDEVGLAALKAVGAEQSAQDRNIADPRHLGDELLGGV